MAQALHSGFVQAIVRVGYCPFFLLLLTFEYISLLYATPVIYLAQTINLLSLSMLQIHTHHQL